MPDALGRLRNYAREKYLFHGSHIAGLKLLEPRPASDVNSADTFSNDIAVFASDNFCMSLLFGLVDFSKVPLSKDACRWSVDGQKNGETTEIISKMPEQWRKYIEEEAVGHIYIFSREAFLETDGLQWKSKVPVAPIACVQVTLKDFYASGGKIEWIDVKNSGCQHDGFKKDLNA